MTLAALAPRTARLAFVLLCAGFVLQSPQAISQGNGVNPDILLNLEEPKDGMRYQGVANLRGWAVAPVPLAGIEVYLDGSYLFPVPLGGTRIDVEDAFPDYPNAGESGFAMALNYGDYPRGAHTLTIRANDSNGGYTERTVEFEIISFPTAYIRNDPDDPAIRVDDANFNIDIDDGFCIQDMSVSVDEATSIPHDLCLRWRNETQGFAIETISP